MDEEAKANLNVDELLAEDPSSEEEGSSTSDCEDMERYDHFVILQSEKGKIHKPAKADEVAPACGISSSNFVRLEIEENWGERDL